MEQQPTTLSHHMSCEQLNLDSGDDQFFKSCITRESTKLRRFSASNLKSFREEARSFRYNAPTTTISSTASSPGYTSRDIIDPSTYSFTEALKALQTRGGRDQSILSVRRSIHPNDHQNPLHSKWNEAERYICNPLSGQVPVECLSAKALSGRFFGRFTMSAPDLEFSNSRVLQTNPSIITCEEEPSITEMESCRRVGSRRIILTRDVGTQSSPQDLGSISCSNYSPDSAPSIKEITVTSCGMEGERPSVHEELIKPKEEEVIIGGKEIEIKLQEKKGGDRIGMFKCKLGSCLGWGLPAAGKKAYKKGEMRNQEKWQLCS